MKKVTLTGTGQLNGPVPIKKTLELEDNVASKLTGQNRDKAILALLAVHYPGVDIKPNQIGIVVEQIKEKKKSKNNTSKKQGSGIIGGAIAGGVASFLNDTKPKTESKDNKSNKTRYKPVVEDLLHLEFNDPNTIQNQLDLIYLKLSTCKFPLIIDNDEVDKENRMYLRQTYQKYLYGIDSLKMVEFDEMVLEKYNKQVKSLSRRTIWQQWWLFILILGLIFVFFILSLF